MKKTLLMLLAVASTTVTFAQKRVEKTSKVEQMRVQQNKAKFSKAEQMEVQKILGKDYTAVLGKSGQLAIVTPDRVGQLKSTAKGGFTGKPGLAANAVLAAYEKAWIYKQSGSVIKDKLGEERFKQLNSILESKVGR